MIAFSLFLHPASHGRDISELADKPPQLLESYLPESSYVTVSARRLANARVLYLNFDLLREMGFDFPADGLNPGFEKRILDLLAYKIPDAGENPASYENQETTWWVDKYGGIGIGQNTGSGRAGSRGVVQIKGFGKTPLVASDGNFDHAHGGASIEE